MSALRSYFLFPTWDLVGHNPAPVQGENFGYDAQFREPFFAIYDSAVRRLEFFQFAGKPQKIAKGTTLFSENRKGMPLLLMPTGSTCFWTVKSAFTRMACPSR